MALDKFQKNAIQKRWASIRAFGKVEFENFSDFLAWCEESGYESGAKLMRRDSEKPFSRENCYWSSDYISETYDKERAIRAAEWERGVGPIREMLRSEIDAQLRKQEQEKEIEIQRNGRQMWFYEHPDLVREGIVWRK